MIRLHSKEKNQQDKYDDKPYGVEKRLKPETDTMVLLRIIAQRILHHTVRNTLGCPQCFGRDEVYGSFTVFWRRAAFDHFESIFDSIDSELVGVLIHRGENLPLL